MLQEILELRAESRKAWRRCAHAESKASVQRQGRPHGAVHLHHHYLAGGGTLVGEAAAALDFGIVYLNVTVGETAPLPDAGTG